METRQRISCKGENAVDELLFRIAFRRLVFFSTYKTVTHNDWAGAFLYSEKQPYCPALYRFNVAFSNADSLASSRRNSSLGCTVNNLSSKSRKSRIVSRPRLLERATYALNAEKVPEGGFAMSTITFSIVCPWDLKSVKAYAGVRAN